MAELPNGAETPVVVVIDRMSLRRAELDSFLRPWADRLGLGVEVAPTSSPLTERAAKGCKLAIVSLGGDPFKDPANCECISALQAALPAVPIVVLSDRDDPDDVFAAFQAGVSGFVPTSTEPAVALHVFSLIINGGSFFPPQSLRRIQHETDLRAGGPNGRLGPTSKPYPNGLTLRQHEVLVRLGTGKPNKVIARELHMCEATVKVHVRQIMRKLGASNRTEAALICMRGDAKETPAGVAAGARGSVGIPDAPERRAPARLRCV